MKQFIADAVTVFVENGTTFLLSPSGDRLGKLTGVTLVDNYDNIPTVTATLYCNVVGSELEANQKYKAAALAKLQEELKKQAEELKEAALQATRKFKNDERVILTIEEGAGTIEAEGIVKDAWFTRVGEHPRYTEAATWDYKIEIGGPYHLVYRFENEIRKID